MPRRDSMRNTASISIADRQVDEIANITNCLYKGSRAVKHEIAVECKAAIDIQFSHIKEKNRVRKATDEHVLVPLIDKHARAHGLREVL